MKLKWLLNNMQVTVLTLGVAGLMAGCCNKSKGGSYTYNAPPYSSASSGATAETKESQPSATTQAGANTVIPLYKEAVTVGTRQVEDGQVRLRKVVKTETVNQPVQLRTESVVIDRVPATSGQVAEGAQPFQGQEMVIQLHHEEPVVSMQVVSAGQIVAQTRADIQETNIQREVRSEDVTVDKGNAQNVTVSENVTSQSNPNQAMGGGGEVGGQSSSTSTITEPSGLTSAEVSAVEGKTVRLNGVRVDQVSGQMIAIKDETGRPLYIRSSLPLEGIKQGDTVNVKGTVKRVSPSTATSMTDLSDEMMQSFKGQQLYVNAQSIEEAK